MRTLAALLVTLLLSVPAWGGGASMSAGEGLAAAEACTQTCGLQDFTVQPPAEQWTYYDGDQGACPVAWNADQALRRTLNSGLCNTNGWAKFRGDIAEDGCAAYRVALDNAGSGNIRFGFIARAANTATDTEHFALVCDTTDGSTTACRPVSVPSGWNLADSCATFGAVGVSAGSWTWVGMCVRGVGPETVIKAFNLGTGAYPGDPDTSDGGATWGAAECTFTPLNCVDGFGNFLCDNSGNFFGIFFGNNSDLASYTQADDFRTYSCMD